MICTVREEILIPLSKDECWEKMRDLTLAKYYVPDVYRVVIDTPHKEGVGVRRTAFSRSIFKWTHETVTKWVPGQAISLTLHRGKGKTFPFIFDAISFNYLISDSPDGTFFTPTIVFEPTFSFATKFLEKRMSIMLRTLCIAMEEFYRTEVPISPDRMSEISDQVKKRFKTKSM